MANPSDLRVHAGNQLIRRGERPEEKHLEFVDGIHEPHAGKVRRMNFRNFVHLKFRATEIFPMGEFDFVEGLQKPFDFRPGQGQSESSAAPRRGRQLRAGWAKKLLKKLPVCSLLQGDRCVEILDGAGG